LLPGTLPEKSQQKGTTFGSGLRPWKKKVATLFLSEKEGGAPKLRIEQNQFQGGNNGLGRKMGDPHWRKEVYPNSTPRI